MRVLEIILKREKLLKHLQYGGPDGELGASLRYLSQRFSMPNEISKATLNDIGTEELAHLEMIGTIVYQLTRNLTPEQIKSGGFDQYFVDHGTGIYPASAAGVPFNAACLASKADVIADLNEDLAADGAIVQDQPFTKKYRHIISKNIDYTKSEFNARV